MKLFKLIIILSFFILLSKTGYTQDRFVEIEEKINLLKATTPGLSQNVELSVNGISIQEFIRALATTNNLNISVDASLNEKIYNNFSNVPVSDVLVFLARKYDLEVRFIGNIITFSKFIPPPSPIVKAPRKQLSITYNKETNLLSFDAQNDSLQAFVKELTRISGKNVLIATELSNKIINGFIQNQPFQSALDLLAFANDLKVTESSENTFLIEKLDKSIAKGNPANSNQSRGAGSGVNGFSYTIDQGKITATGINVPIADIIHAISSELKLNYFLFSEIKGSASLSVVSSTYEQFLSHILNGTEYTYKTENSIYLIGDRNLEGLRATKVIQLQNRTADKVSEFIPVDLKKGVDIKPFPDQNSVILSGSAPRITEIESFLRDIDRVVPVIAIDVMIMDVNDSKTLSTGIEAGLNPPGTPNTTSGEVHPGIDLNINSTTLNDIITGISGLGIINLGRVTPDFYFRIKALETQGILKLNSIPKLAALNGNEASMNIGKTEYYREEVSNISQGLNTTNIITRQYKSVKADLSITIKPIVSGDEQITLNITVKQSSFTSRFEPNAPPGTITREFQSIIRVKNEEMIMLGGLDENSTSETGRGLPLLQRIPVLKWIFSSRTKGKTKSRLTIFIKPSVLY